MVKKSIPQMLQCHFFGSNSELWIFSVGLSYKGLDISSTISDLLGHLSHI